MSIQTKTMTVKSDTSLAETTTTIRDTVTFDVSSMPNGITYKGLKAVLSFADPIQWNKASTYDSLTVVWDDATHASYASKRPVPQNIELTNKFYWLRTADLDAQVEMYRQEVQEFDGRITAVEGTSAKNTADIGTLTTDIGKLAAKTTKNALYVGNSYTTGYSSDVSRYAIFDQTSYVWDKAYSVSGSSAGFCFGPRDYNFYTLLSGWAAEHVEQAKTLTHVIFNVAVGDAEAFALDYAKATNDMTTCINNIMTLLNSTAFPNIERVLIFDCDALYKNYRATRSANTYVHITTMMQVHNYICKLTNNLSKFAKRYSVEYCGWVGWNLFARGDLMGNTDNIHPTVLGYQVLSRYWLAALNGHVNYSNLRFKHMFDLAPFADGLTVTAFTEFTPSMICNSFQFKQTGTPTIKSPQNWVTFNAGASFFNTCNTVNIDANVPLNIEIAQNNDMTQISIRSKAELNFSPYYLYRTCAFIENFDLLY